MVLVRGGDGIGLFEILVAICCMCSLLKGHVFLPLLPFFTFHLHFFFFFDPQRPQLAAQLLIGATNETPTKGVKEGSSLLACHVRRRFHTLNIITNVLCQNILLLFSHGEVLQVVLISVSHKFETQNRFKLA